MLAFIFIFLLYILLLFRFSFAILKFKHLWHLFTNNLPLGLARLGKSYNYWYLLWPFVVNWYVITSLHKLLLSMWQVMLVNRVMILPCLHNSNKTTWYSNQSKTQTDRHQEYHFEKETTVSSYSFILSFPSKLELAEQLIRDNKV